ncbi:MAG TPA: hypothetical protein VFI25_07490 [Planctomycetota bacterium]|jgi:hypothetical protein|nr:hypothetical protein [Planctomycetota bacterium]
MRKVFIAAGMAAALLAVGAPAQPVLCPAGGVVTSYRSDPIPSAFASIVGQPGAVGVFLPQTDDTTSFVPFGGGFAFAYHGVAKTQVGICSNGWITFTSTASATPTNVHPGDGLGPNDAIFPWHDDLVVVSPGSRVDYRFDSLAQTLAVQWTGVGNFVSGAPPATLVGRGSFTFQCVLYGSGHPTQPNTIELRYDRSTAPPVMGACQTTNAGTTATSATVGCENALGDPLCVGVDPTANGAANGAFPPCDLRLTPATYATPGLSAVTSLVPQEPFCHIEGLPGTVALPGPCAGGCYDDESASDLTGDDLALGKWVVVCKKHVCGANMSANGFLAMGQGTDFANFANTLLPSPAEPELVVAPFWDDLEAKSTSGMFYRVDGVPGCRVWTFEWHDFGAFVGPSGDCAANGSVTMQARFFEGSAGSVAAGSCPPAILPGNGNDRIEFLYDHANFVSGPFTASIGVENQNGTAAATCLPGNTNASPASGMKCVIDDCDSGEALAYGDRSNNAPAGVPACLPTILTNSVPPIVGNPFGLQVLGASPSGIAILLLDGGPAIPGLRTPVPCGGVPSPFGTFWVNLGSALLLVAGPTSPGGPCEGCAKVDLPIPNVSVFVGAVIYAQWAVVSVAGFGLLVELTEGNKITIG